MLVPGATMGAGGAGLIVDHLPRFGHRQVLRTPPARDGPRTAIGAVLRARGAGLRTATVWWVIWRDRRRRCGWRCRWLRTWWPAPVPGRWSRFGWWWRSACPCGPWCGFEGVGGGEPVGGSHGHRSGGDGGDHTALGVQGFVAGFGVHGELAVLGPPQLPTAVARVLGVLRRVGRRGGGWRYPASRGWWGFARWQHRPWYRPAGWSVSVPSGDGAEPCVQCLNAVGGEVAAAVDDADVDGWGGSVV